MMRPEFILHYLAAIPSEKAVQDSFDSIFPTNLGIQLGSRLEESLVSGVLEHANQIYDEYDESRAKVVLANKSAELQSDFRKQYEGEND